MVAVQGAESPDGMLPCQPAISWPSLPSPRLRLAQYADCLCTLPGSSESTLIWQGRRLGASCFCVGTSWKLDGCSISEALPMARCRVVLSCGALYGFALWLAGVAKGHQPLRLAALGLLTLTTAKVFLLDLSWLDTPYRIVSFLGLGLILLWVSVRYSRSGTPPWLKA